MKKRLHNYIGLILAAIVTLSFIILYNSGPLMTWMIIKESEYNVLWYDLFKYGSVPIISLFSAYLTYILGVRIYDMSKIALIDPLIEMNNILFKINSIIMKYGHLTPGTEKEIEEYDANLHKFASYVYACDKIKFFELDDSLKHYRSIFKIVQALIKIQSQYGGVVYSKGQARDEVEKSVLEKERLRLLNERFTLEENFSNTMKTIMKSS